MRIIPAIFIVVVALAGCKNDGLSSGADLFSVFGDQAGKQVILFNRHTGKTWRLDGQVWRPIPTIENPEDPLGLFSREPAKCKDKNPKEMTNEELCGCRDERYDPTANKCL